MWGPFHALDWVLLAWLLYGAIRGGLRGLSGELGRLLALVFILGLAWRCGPRLADILSGQAGLSASGARALAFSLLLLGGFLLMVLARLMLRRWLAFTFKGAFERWGGAALGLLGAGLIAMAALMGLAWLPHEGVRAAVTQDARIARTLYRWGPRLYDPVSEKLDLPPYAPPAAPTGAPAADTRPEWQELPPPDAVPANDTP